MTFIELSILPVAAGLEGLDRDSYHRTRLKVVFPTVSQLLQYRKCMALSAPDVVALVSDNFLILFFSFLHHKKLFAFVICIRALLGLIVSSQKITLLYW